MTADITPGATAGSTAPPSVAARAVATPYLAVRGGLDALRWYTEAFGATETFRVVGDDGRVGHAELDIGGARLMLSDEYPEIGVHSPAGLDGTSVSLHLEVPDVDERFARAVAAGATAVNAPADQDHGSRHGTLVDPYGHRWMLSTRIEQVDLGTYAQRAAASGFDVQPGDAPSGGAPAGGEPGIWAGLSYRDAPAGIRFLVDVVGFELQALAADPDDPDVVVHSELRWPEGGVVQAGTYVPDNEFMQAPGAQAIYVITRDPWAVWERCRSAGVEVVRPPEEPHYDPGGMGFSVRDPEGNILSFGSYAGGVS
ncbi:MAG: VOC family protein [Acidimicrobiia bacterium]|nr:VOC family protein [Acidimicrobiia bacterium]